MAKYSPPDERCVEVKASSRSKVLQNKGRTAVWQARLVLLVMINIAQLWILSAAVEAALAHEYKQLMPLVIASGACWLIALSVIVWWKPAVRH